jgi:phosphatidylinositol alpha-1,6-mannosyltransferase
VPPESSRRKILLVTNDLGPRSGGIETFIHGLLEKLDGSQIVILTSSQEGGLDFDKELKRKFGLIVYRDRSKVLLPTPRVIRRAKELMRAHEATTIWFGAAAPLETNYCLDSWPRSLVGEVTAFQFSNAPDRQLF